MKTVFANHMVAHIWAQQNQAQGRSHNGNFHFDGPTLFSYRTPIANFVTGAKGERVVLISSNSYSMTTATRHMGPAWRAIDYGRSTIAFKVPHIGAWGGRTRHGGAPMDAQNVDYLASEYDGEKATMLRARTSPYGSPSERLTEAAAKYEAYCAVFALERRHKFTPAADGALILERFERLAAKQNDPKEIARQEKAAARRDQVKEFAGLYDAAVGEHGLRARLTEWREGRLQELPYGVADLLTDADRAEYVHRQATKIERWRAGERVYLNRGAPVMMRVKGDNIETSMGAEFPVEHGKRAFRLIVAVRGKGEGWQRNGHSVHLGHFQIDRIEANGDVRARCHFVAWSEIARCAKQLGLID